VRSYLIKRLFLMIPTMFGISIVVFVIINIAPGQPTPIQVGSGGGTVSKDQLASKESLLIFKRQWNLDKPIILNLRPFFTKEEKIERLLLDTTFKKGTLKIKASEELENLWHDAVPHLVSLLEKARTEGEDSLTSEARKRNDRLRLYLINFLSQNAKRRVVKVHRDEGQEKYTPAQLRVQARNEDISLEKARFDAWKYLESDFKDDVNRDRLLLTRDRLEKRWIAWFHGQKASAPRPDLPDAVVDAAKVLVDENPSQGVGQFVRKLVSAFGHGAMTALVEHLLRALFDDPSDEGIDKLAQKLLSAYGPGAVTSLVEHLLKNPQNDWDWTLLGPLLVETVKLHEPLPDEASAKEKMAYQARWKNNTYDPAMTVLEKEMLVARWQDWWTGAEHRFERTDIEKVVTLFTDTRFANYISKVALLDFGDSIQYKGEDVLDLIFDRLKVSITFAILAFIIAYTVSIPIGIYSAVRKDTISDRCITFVLFLLYATPSFYLATILLTYLTNKEFIAIFPTGGFEGSYAGDLTTLEYIKDVAWHIALPLACMTYASFATLSRYARAGLLEVIRSDYVRTARAKGLSEPVVILKHALRNGVIPILTMVGGILPALIGGSVIIEKVFNINGMGKLMFDSIIARDYNVVMGDSLIAAFLVLCGILVSDITYVLVDPRISFD